MMQRSEIHNGVSDFGLHNTQASLDRLVGRSVGLIMYIESELRMLLPLFVAEAVYTMYTRRVVI